MRNNKLNWILNHPSGALFTVPVLITGDDLEKSNKDENIYPLTACLLDLPYHIIIKLHMVAGRSWSGPIDLHLSPLFFPNAKKHIIMAMECVLV